MGEGAREKVPGRRCQGEGASPPRGDMAG